MKPNPKIITMERTNEKYVYLYSYGDKAWIAYGRSAVHLHLLLPHISFKRPSSSECGEVMVVDRLSIAWLLEKHSPEIQTTFEIVLRVPELLLRLSNLSF